MAAGERPVLVRRRLDRRTRGRSSGCRPGSGAGSRATSSRCRSRRWRCGRRASRRASSRAIVVGVSWNIDRLGHLQDQPDPARGRSRRGWPGGPRRTSAPGVAAADRLTATVTVSGRSPTPPSAAAWRQASSSTQRPSAQDDARLLGERDELVRADEAARRVPPADERLDAVRPRPSRARRSAGSRPTSSPRPRLRDSSALSAWRATIAACIVGSKTATRFLPAALAVYIATSALRSSSSARLGRRSRRRRCRCCAPTTISWPSIGNGAAARRRCGSRPPRRGSTPRRRRAGRANSSPPSRAATSSGRRTLAEPFRDRDEQPVAGCVTQGVVDDLEVVEVQEEDDRSPSTAA